MAQTLRFRRRQLVLAVVVAGGLAALCDALIAITRLDATAPGQVVSPGWEVVDTVVRAAWVTLLTGLGGAWWQDGFDDDNTKTAVLTSGSEGQIAITILDSRASGAAR